jgi:hypothetical protein
LAQKYLWKKRYAPVKSIMRLDGIEELSS